MDNCEYDTYNQTPTIEVASEWLGLKANDIFGISKFTEVRIEQIEDQIFFAQNGYMTKSQRQFYLVP